MIKLLRYENCVLHWASICEIKYFLGKRHNPWHKPVSINELNFQEVPFEP